MICKQCMKENSDGARFCKHCGAPLEEAPVTVEAAAPVVTAQTAPAAAQEVTVATAQKPKGLSPKMKKMLMWMIPAAAVVLIVAIVLAVVFINLGRQVDIGAYLNFEVTGYEGYSNMSYDFDEYSFAKRLKGDKNAVGYVDSSDSSLSDAAEMLQMAMDKKLSAVINSVEVETQLPEGKTPKTLVNGDKITITVSCNEELAAQYNVDVKPATIEYEVTGLNTLDIFDVLANFTVEYAGYQNYGTATLVCTKTETLSRGELFFVTEEGSDYISIQNSAGDDFGSIRVWLSDTQYLTNGDILTLQANVSEETYLSYGVICENLTRELTVEGLEEPQEFDLISYYTAIFSGVTGSGTAAVDGSQETVEINGVVFDLKNRKYTIGENYSDSFSVSLSKTRNLTNGETITLTISSVSYTDRLLENGVKLLELTKEITVSGLSEYAKNMDEVRDALANNNVEEFGMEEIRTTLAGNYNWRTYVEGSTYSFSGLNNTIGDDMKLYKMILTVPKDGESTSNKNNLWIIFTATVSDKNMAANTQYMGMMLTDIYEGADGVIYYNKANSKLYTSATYEGFCEKNMANVDQYDFFE